MIVVRNVFRLKFGKAREAIAATKQTLEIGRKVGMDPSRVRLMTDLVGDFYTLVMEITFNDLADSDHWASRTMSLPEWKAAYEKVIPLVESGYREIFNIVE